MKKFAVLFFAFVFVLAAYVPLCAQGRDTVVVEQLTFTEKIKKLYDDFLNSEQVQKSITTVKENWQAFKNWFNNLPGIRDYNNSVYSSKNWKKEMGEMSGEYSPYLKKDSAGVKMLKEGKKEWDKL